MKCAAGVSWGLAVRCPDVFAPLQLFGSLLLSVLCFAEEFLADLLLSRNALHPLITLFYYIWEDAIRVCVGLKNTRVAIGLITSQTGPLLITCTCRRRVFVQWLLKSKYTQLRSFLRYSNVRISFHSLCSHFSLQHHRSNGKNGQSWTYRYCGEGFSHPLMSHNGKSWSHISHPHWPSPSLPSVDQACLPRPNSRLLSLRRPHKPMTIMALACQTD